MLFHEDLVGENERVAEFTSQLGERTTQNADSQRVSDFTIELPYGWLSVASM